jgi:hypothetical protein
MSGPLATVLAQSTDDELRATRRLLHRAWMGRDRLGWPSSNPFARHFRKPFAVSDEPPSSEPALVAAACLEISDEIERRGIGLPCYPCQATLEHLPVPPVTAGSTVAHYKPVPSLPASTSSGG